LKIQSVYEYIIFAQNQNAYGSVERWGHGAAQPNPAADKPKTSRKRDKSMANIWGKTNKKCYGGLIWINREQIRIK
jgi:hypothetical protein